MTPPTVVRGLSWAHTRGHAPLVTTGAAWSDRHPDVGFAWTPRSLAEFANGELSRHLGEFDLVALDYPLIGEAAEHGWIEPLDEVLSAPELDVLRAGALGGSFESYVHAGRPWAAPLDAAALTSAYREDLLPERAVPRTYDELLALARDTGRVAVPLTVFGAAALFFSLCAQEGVDPVAADGARLAEQPAAVHAVTRLADLAAAVPPWCLESGAVPLLSRLAAGDDLLYVGYAYGYSTYARRGYFPHRLTFTAPPPIIGGTPARATLGGVGLAVLAEAPARAAAIDYLRWVTSAECQSGVFTTSGGQPALAAAWADPDLDRLTNGFFSATRESIEQAYVRPNAPWFGRFQATAGRALQELVRGSSTPAQTLDALDAELRTTSGRSA